LPQSGDMLLALPVKGESFLLRRAGRAVLVDGGCEKDNIADVMARYVRDVTHFDVVLCTHGDADHAGGLPNLLNR
jgi:glyoxylase-like metal-dependent hydrolase (beta-lactamase superfamily II)